MDVRLADALFGHAASLADVLAPHEFASIAWAVAAVRRHDVPLMTTLNAHAISQLTKFGAREIANVSWALAKLRLGEPRMLEGLISVASERLPSFRPQEIANVAWAAAAQQQQQQQQSGHGSRVSHALSALLGAIGGEVAARELGAFDAQELAALSWAFAASRCTSSPALGAVSAAAQELLREGNAMTVSVRNLANIVWAFARLQVTRGGSIDLDAIARAPFKRLSSIKRQELANTAWACALLVCSDIPFLDAIASRALSEIGELQPQELANVSWALSTLQRRHEPFLAGLSEQPLDNFSAQNLANIAWAVSALRWVCEPFLGTLFSSASATVETARAQELASLAWSMATLKWCSEPLLEAVLPHAIANIHGFSPQGLANSMWAVATLPMFDDPFFDAVAAASIPCMHQFGAQEVANMAWSLATMKLSYPELFDGLLIVAQERLCECKPMELSGLAWSCARLPVQGPFMRAVGQASFSSLDDFGPQELAGVAWAMSRGNSHASSTPLLTAIAELLPRRVDSVRHVELRHVEMVLSAASGLEDTQVAWSLLQAAAGTAALPLRSLSLSGLLAMCESRGLRSQEGALLDMLEGLEGPGIAAAVRLSAALRAAQEGDAVSALRLAEKQFGADESATTFAPLARVWLACGGHRAGCRPVGAMTAVRGAPELPPSVAHAKEAMLLEHVLREARPGEPSTVLRSMDDFGAAQLSKPLGGALGGASPTAGKWLKVAGGEKALVLLEAAKTAPPGSDVLEVGTYCGYTAIRLASGVPGRLGPKRVTTLEADPALAAIARSLAVFAGVAHRVDVVTGHSEETLRTLRGGKRGGRGFGMVFFDQKGSRYLEDLETLLSEGLLMPGAVLVADNVLKPGAPAFLWRVLFGGDFQSRIIRVEEFAMPGVEDWMSFSVYAPRGPASVPPAPPALRRLEWEADAIRSRAESGRPGVSFAEWAAHARLMRRSLAEFGIAPASCAQQLRAGLHEDAG